MAGKVPMKVLSVQEMSFTDKSTGELRKMWRVYIADDTGAVGSVYHGKPVSIGATVNLGLAVNKEGKTNISRVDIQSSRHSLVS